MFSQIGPLEIVLVVVVLLVIFGPKRLPSLGKQLGTGMREFKDSITGEDRERKQQEGERPVLTQAEAQPAAPAPAPAEPAPVDAAPDQRG